MPVFLIGYMGSGKSTIGSQISTNLNKPFLDLDNLIEQEIGLSLNQIFNEKGEDFFRKKEHSVLTNYNFDSHSIIATGGGTPCFYNNHDFMKSIGSTIYLKVGVSEIVSRLELDNKRPLLFNNKLNLRDFVKGHLFEREKYYSRSDYVVESDSIRINEILKIVKRIL